MRNKIRQMMKKEDGFTLVELLAVIVILGIIVAIAIPAVGRVIDGARRDSRDAETALVIDAARLYFTSEDPNGTSVTVQRLEETGFLEERGGETIQPGTVTRTQESNGTWSYEFNSSGE